MLLLPPPLSTTVKRECQPSLEIRGLGDGTQTGRAVSCVDWRFKSVKTSLTCRSGECDDCGFYHAAECALKPLCAFWKRHSWSRSVQRGPEEEEFGVLPFFSILPPSLPFHAHRLPPSFSVCVRESGGTLREWVSQSVSQLTLLTRTGGSPPPHPPPPGYHRRTGKAPGGSLCLSLIVPAGHAQREQSGVRAGRLKNERTRAERENAAAPGAAARGEDNALSVKVTDETGSVHVTEDTG